MKKIRWTRRSGKPFSTRRLQFDGGDLVTVAAFPSATEAYLLRSWLEADGIQCVLGNEFIAAIDSPISMVTGGIQVRVRPSDVPRAQSRIEALRAR